ncbi:regulator of chromosome condensation [Purpureocillium lilacinum]|uniref:Regulator of chromosome condensation n=1 Tax=Purpureocillium lilacinum TaxID=33203 RepID=A0A179HTL6_PURLI|nr:regulator of chromosome condensation [Purpureocillium lilacinum]OAQ93717.1 regulator of chromosome condensation [Purpureocillium lilacinum]
MSSRRSRPTPKSTPAAPKAAAGSRRKHASSAAAQPPRKKQKTTKEAPLNAVPETVLAVFMFGSGENGELGLGPKVTASKRPKPNPHLDAKDSSALHIVRLACGGMHTVALTADNRLITWGVNDNDALGRPTNWEGKLRDADAGSDNDDAELNPRESTPTEVSTENIPGATKFVDVAAGDSCSFAVTDTGLVYGWGTFRNSEGKESFGYTAGGALIKRQPVPMLIPGLLRVTQLVCGANHALALDAAGTVWAWGCGQQNQFGRRLFGRHQESLRPRPVPVCRSGARLIASGEYHCFAVGQRRDDVWGWGLNSFGQTGDATSAGGDSALLPYPVKIPALCGQGVAVIAGGAHHSVAITADGQVYTWGRMDGGHLGIKFTDQQLGDDTVVRRDERDKPRICLQPTPVPQIGEAVHAACGTDHTIFVAKDGRAWATGFGSEGQLGLGSDDDVDVAQLIQGKAVKDRKLTWAGAGGQFSSVAGPAA